MNKYRAWDKEKKETYEVTCIDFIKKMVCVLETVSTVPHRWIPFKKLELMQSTWLKDNSEKPIEIWQKSIVKVVGNDGDYFIGVVDYFGDQDYPAFDIDQKYYKGWHFDSNVLSEALGSDDLKIYVIGDVYRNPELLKEVE